MSVKPDCLSLYMSGRHLSLLHKILFNINSIEDNTSQVASGIYSLYKTTRIMSGDPYKMMNEVSSS